LIFLLLSGLHIFQLEESFHYKNLRGQINNDEALIPPHRVLLHTTGTPLRQSPSQSQRSSWPNTKTAHRICWWLFCVLTPEISRVVAM